MGRKGIVKYLRAEIDKWLKTIDNEELRREVDNHLIVTGGAIASLLMGEKVNDIDIYFDNVDTCKKLVDHYLAKLVQPQNGRVGELEARAGTDSVQIYIKSAGIVASEDGDELEDYRYFEQEAQGAADEYLSGVSPLNNRKEYEIAFATSNAITLVGPIQIITRFVGPADEIHKNYDFVHATNYYTKSSGLVLNLEALESLMCRQLRYVGSKFPICSLFRTRKFIKRGFSINAGEMFKIAYDVNKLDLNDHDTMREQLIGVDAAYFHEVLNILKGASAKEIDRTYLFEILDRVFTDDESEIK